MDLAPEVGKSPSDKPVISDQRKNIQWLKATTEIYGES